MNMKKVILLFAAIAITAGAYAQTDSTNTKLNSRDMNNNEMHHMQHSPVHESHPDGVMMKNGKMMMVKDGQFTVLDHEMTMSNGTTVMADGTWTKKDGTKMKMNEGEHIDMDGKLISMEAKKDKNMDFVPDSTKKQD
jgi:hypothetical protein